MLDKMALKRLALCELYIVITSFIFVIFAEGIWRGYAEALLWIELDGFGKYLISCIVVILIQNFFLFLVGRLDVSICISGIILSMLSAISYNKFLLNGNYLSVVDFQTVKDAVRIVGNYDILITRAIVVGLFIPFICATIFCDFKLYMKSVSRLCFCVAIIMLFVFGKPVFSNLFATVGAFEILTLQEYYEKNGIIFSLIKTIPEKMKKPSEYNQHKVDQIIADIEYDQGGSSQKASYPNIIFIMNESFSSNLLDLLQPSENAIPFFQELSKTYLNGSFLSPSYGGLTCQVEYEVLSGYSADNTGSSVVYNSMIKKNMDSMVSVLNEIDYYTLGMHPYTKHFFSRDRVYECLGFDKTLFIEEMENVELVRNLPSDLYTYKELIKEFEKRPDDTPFFSYVVTMQNHGGYSAGYDEYGIKVTADFETTEQQGAAETYANLMRKSDDALRYLVEYFSGVKEPTIIVFFGDHWPGIKSFGMDVPEGERDINLYETPLLIWDNYRVERENVGCVSAYNLGAKVMQIAGVPTDAYFQFLIQSDIINGTNKCYIKDGTVIDESMLDQEEKDKLQQMWVLQYDRMFGKNYSKEQK